MFLINKNVYFIKNSYGANTRDEEYVGIFLTRKNKILP